jgi:polyisoprenoid-binding protein YceI
MPGPDRKSRVFNGNLLPAAGQYTVDPAHTFVEFAVQHVVVGQVRGRFDSVAGTIWIAEDPLRTAVEVDIDTASVSTHNKDRDNDLRSPRFFDVEKFPTMIFVSSGVRTEPSGRFTLDGKLTIKGVAHPVSLAVAFSGIVEDPWGNTRAACQAVATVNRKDLGLVADLERETGGLLVGKDVVIMIAAEAILKKPAAP